MKYLIVILFCCFFFKSYTQVSKFNSKPLKYETGDTIYFKAKNKVVYNYFIQDFSSSLMFSFDSISYSQIEAVNKSNGRGYFKIFSGNKLISYYDISNWKIQGIGMVYYTSGRPFYFGTFINGKLDGSCTFFDLKSVITKIAKFKKGKFKKYIYFQDAKNKKALKEGNKKAKGPFVPITSYNYGK